MTIIDPLIQSLMADTAQSVLEVQSKVEAPLYGEKWLPHDNSVSGRSMHVKIRTGKTSEITNLKDGGTIGVTGRRVNPADIQVDPAIVLGRMKMTRAEAVEVTGVAQTINLVRETIEEFGESILSEIDLGMIYGGEYEASLTAAMVTALTTGTLYNNLNAATEAAPITLVVTDPGPYDVGQSLEFYSIVTATGIATLQARAIVTAVDADYAAGVFSVSMYGSGEVTAALAPISGTTNPVKITQRGAYVSGTVDTNTMIGLTQICDEDLDLYGYSRALNNWKPQQHDAGTSAPSGAALRTMNVQLARQKGAKGRFVLMNSDVQNALHTEALTDRQITGLEFNLTEGSMTGRVGNTDFKIDENCRSTSVFFCDPSSTELAVFVPLLTDGDGKPGMDKGSDHWQLTPGEFTIFQEKWTMHQLRCRRRSSSGRIINLG